MPQLVSFLLFLVFVQDAGCAYSTHLGAPLGWVYDLLLKPTPLELRPFDLIMLVILAVSSSKKRREGAYVRPMKNALLVVLATTMVWFGFGLAKGGEVRFASWQTYLILSCVLVAFTVASTFRSVADFQRLGKWLIVASLYRGLMCWISYFTWGRLLVGESGAFLTSHDDTICWVVAILVLTIGAIDKRSVGVTIRNLAIIAFLLGAIQFNSRRLAWVSLSMGFVVLYALLPKGVAKRTMNRALLTVVPMVLIYAAVGWGRGNPIFLPLRALSSVTTQEDGSTLARNAENLGLIATANYSHFFLGTGWGRPYVFLTLKYDISGFELWRYIPHNSILGLLAFTGVLGFAGFWLPIPTAVFLNARAARLASDPRIRNIALVGAAQLIVSANQLYGDMGLFSLEAMYVMGVSYGIALRLPLLAGVWNASTPKAARAR